MNEMLPSLPGPIGVFDSGYGGLTILHQMRQLMPQYDYLYLGDNARTPYGPRSFEVVYEFTWEAVRKLFSMGCHLVILACNTASAKALRSIQQRDLPPLGDDTRRVLGVIRPTAECIGQITQTRHVGVLATSGTISSGSYPLEIHKLYPDIVVSGEACPMWVPLVENYEYDSPGADYFVQKRIGNLLRKDPQIDTIEIHSPQRPHRAARRICGLQPEGLPWAPSGDCFCLHPGRHLPVPDHGKSGAFHGLRFHLPPPPCGSRTCGAGVRGLGISQADISFPYCGRKSSFQFVLCLRIRQYENTGLARKREY